MPPARSDGAPVISKLLEDTNVGRFSVPVASLQHTSIGRPLHNDGIAAIEDSILAQGWLGSKMTVSLVGSVPDEGLTDDVAADQQYRLINGNHRLAALLRIAAENKVADPPRNSTEVIEVEVHAGLSLEQERLIALSLNLATELVVKTTLSDRVRWYKGWHDDIQSKTKGKAMSSNAVASKFMSESKKAGASTQSPPTVKKIMKIVQAMKPRALAALHDVTHLPGRALGHLDLQPGAKLLPKLLHSRVTAVSLEREQFAALSDTEQEVYIYRLASVDQFPGVVTAETYLTLDQMAKDVARMIDSAERHLGPVSCWSDDFKRLVAKARNYDGSAKFVTHFNGQVNAAETYKRKLPEGMTADEAYMEWMKSKPWSPLVQLIQGSEGAPHEMKSIYDAYEKTKEDKKNDAIAAEGLFKTQLAEKIKSATDAAAAVAAATAAAALLVSTAAAAKAAADAAAASKVTAAKATAQKAAASAEASPAPDPTASGASSTTPVQPAAAGAGVSPSPAALPKTPSATAKEAKGSSSGETVGARLAGTKRKAEKQDAANEVLQKARPIMTKLVRIDILSPVFDAETNVKHPADKPFMLAFVNIAANGGVMTADDGAVLKRALAFLGNSLHDRGTVVMALPDWDFNRVKLKAWFAAEDLILEESPVVSLYLHGKSGRPARKDKFVYPTQGSVTLLAHKSDNFICNGGGPRSGGGEITSRTSARGATVAPPRTMELDRIGAVVSLAHPPNGTHLADATADLLIKRFSDVGDSVLVSAGHRDTSLTRAALREGRVAVVLEPIDSKLADTAASLDKLTGSAAKEGMWARMLKVPVPLVTVGPHKLPILVPVSNIPTSTAVEVEGARSLGDEDPERTVANRCAAQHGLLIRSSGGAGHGLFASKRLDDAPGVFLKMPLVGSFEVHDSVDDSIEAGKDDGLPRFLVSDNMALLLSEGEVSRPNAGLYLVPAKTSPVFYMNSSRTDAALSENVTFVSVLTSRCFRGVESKQAYLKNAMNSVMFDITCVVEKDTELLAHFRSVQD